MQTNSILPADVSHSRLFEALARLRTARRFPDKRYEVIAEEACSLAAEMRGYLSFSHMRSAFYLSSIFEKNKPSFAFTPTNYEIGLSWYDLVNTTLRFLFGERTGIRGLHLASNYGLNVHFLNQEWKYAFLGLDADKCATAIAGRLGIPVLRASADKIPVADGSFDVVFTQNFLESIYLSFLPRQNNFRLSVISEAARVLKRGGFFISSMDFSSRTEIMEEMSLKDWPAEFVTAHQYADENNSDLIRLCQLTVFQKE